MEMGLGTGIAISSLIITTGALLFKVIPKNGYNKSVCESKHRALDSVIEEIKNERKECQLRTEKMLERIDKRFDNLDKKYEELLQMILKKGG